MRHRVLSHNPTSLRPVLLSGLLRRGPWAGSLLVLLARSPHPGSLYHVPLAVPSQPIHRPQTREIKQASPVSRGGLPLETSPRHIVVPVEFLREFVASDHD